MDLVTTYMGLTLKNPLIASASPLTGKLTDLRRLEDNGAAAVILPSMFEEQIEQEVHRYERLANVATNSFPEVGSFFPKPSFYRVGPHRYLELIRRASRSMEIPVIASLNGTSLSGWVEYARLIEEAGAKAIELNVYFLPTDTSLDGIDVELRYVDIVRAVRDAVSLPFAVKISPYFSSLGDMASRLVEAGADALVLFNRFYQPDLDVAQLSVITNLELSTPAEIRLPLLWIGLLAGKIDASIAASTGVESTAEVVKYLLVGADAVMTTSSLLRHGVEHMGELLRGLERWCEGRGFESIGSFKGMLSQRRTRNPQGFERANYIRILQEFDPVQAGG
ncbi:MAG: dihydroorotate dehydrogenase-like protein [Candidatus Eremiobacteraeota bacterium]|nr:dihydroorotate dehydrogenase-like protein [Candidatus Eremiobacteraeota bacterium]